MTNLIEPVKAQSLENSVYLSIKNMIVALKLRPEATLNIATLSALLGVSSTPVRAVLQLLEQEDLVRRVQNKGFYVAPLTKADAEYIYEMRRSLELLALERAIVNIDPVKLASLIEKMKELRKLRDKPQENLSFDLDYSLHDMIISSCGNPYLQKTYSGLMSTIQRYRNVIRQVAIPDERSWIESELEQHIQIGEFILKGDLENATDALRDHLTQLMEIVSERLSKIYLLSQELKE